MPWYAFEYNTHGPKLCQHWNVSGIPRLVIVDAVSGNVICESAVGPIKAEKAGMVAEWDAMCG